MTAPQWVLGTVARVCERYGVAEPEVTWRRSRTNVSSSGRTFHKAPRIVVTAGSDSTDRKLVLLHELAHWVNREINQPEGHSARFWVIAFDLYVEAGLLRAAVRRETEYAGARAEAKRRTSRRPRPDLRALAAEVEADFEESYYLDEEQAG